jgi:hypothetical protein
VDESPTDRRSNPLLQARNRPKNPNERRLQRRCPHANMTPFICTSQDYESDSISRLAKSENICELALPYFPESSHTIAFPNAKSSNNFPTSKSSSNCCLTVRSLGGSGINFPFSDCKFKDSNSLTSSLSIAPWFLPL